MRLIWIIGTALAVFVTALPAKAARQISDIACETTTTAGIGTVNLAGALTGGYLSFLGAGITSGNTVPYNIKNGTQLETGVGTFTDAAPDTLSRTADWSTDGAGAELTLSGTSTVCIGPIARLYNDEDKGDITTSNGFGTWTIDADSVALGTDTTNNYVATVADGTGVDGTASGEGTTYTPTLDLTEINSLTWGSGTFTTETYNAGAVDPVFTFASATLTFSAMTTFNLDDELELRFFEEDAGGTNYKGFKAPAAITANTTCTFENDANFIPDSCVGDGTDDTGTPANYVATVADGTGIDGTASGAGSTYTPTFDATELGALSWGGGSAASYAWTFDLSTGNDPTLTIEDKGFHISAAFNAAVHLTLSDEGELRLEELAANGTNYKALKPPSSITADTTCTLEDDADFIPDSCVGDGVDSAATASTTTAGIAELATDAEAQAMSDTARAITPSNLAAVDAVQADQETATSVTRFVTPGTQQYHPSAAKFWAFCDGTTDTTQASYNPGVTTCDRTAAGLYTISWGTDFSSTNYVVMVSPDDTDRAATSPTCYPIAATRAVGSIDVLCQLTNGTNTDMDFNVVAYGDQP